MHAAERAFAFVVRDVALHNAWIEAVRFKFILTKGARKETALVLPTLGLQNECTLQLGFRKDQTILLESLMLLSRGLRERLCNGILPAQRCVEAP